MASSLLIVPGVGGCGPEHWQHWLAEQVPGSEWPSGIDWRNPVLAQWAGTLRETLAKAPAPVWIVAHDFGCLASVVAAADRPEKVAQLVLVAPADPQRFDCMGLKPDLRLLNERFCLSKALPNQGLQVNGVVVASRNDPDISLTTATAWADRWQLTLHVIGKAGHFTPSAGYGPWPGLLTLLRSLQRTGATPPVATLHNRRKGRGSALAAVRQLTREQLQSPQDHRLWL